MKTMSACLAAAIALALGAGARATTYVGNETIGGIEASLSFTTDGKLGSLAKSDLTAYDISLVSGQYMADLNNTNSNISWMSSDLTATTTALSFDFNGDDSFINIFGLYTSRYVLFSDPNGSRDILAGIGIYSNGGAVLPVSDYIPESGEVVIATAPASGAPEPSIWALMVAGVGGVGAGLRRRRAGGCAAVRAA